MINVTQETKNAYLTDGIHKVIDIYSGSYHFDNDSIVNDSVELSQSIMDGSNLDICGGVSNSLSFKAYSSMILGMPNRDDPIYITIKADDTESIRLFTGYVDTCDALANSNFIAITAYDKLYKISGRGGYVGEDQDQYNIGDWFSNKSNITISSLLNQLCSKFGITIASGNPPLINGNLTIRTKGEGKNPKVTSLSALDLLKDIFRINVCFGYINPDGNLSWKYLETSPYDENGVLYPSDFIFPSNNLFPGTDSSKSAAHDSHLIGFYENLSYRTYTVNSIKRVVVADNKNDKNKGEAGSGYNKYNIYGNHCMLGESQSMKQTAANNVLNKLKDIFYVPFESSNPGLPFFQPGDSVTYYDAKKQKYYRSFIFTRSMKIGQHMTDTFKAEGEQYQREFTVGSETQINEIEDEKVEEIQQEIDTINDDFDDLSNQVENIGGDLGDLTTDYDDFKDYVNDYIDSGGGGAVNIVTVEQLPENPEANTIYLIQGDVMIL